MARPKMKVRRTTRSHDSWGRPVKSGHRVRKCKLSNRQKKELLNHIYLGVTVVSFLVEVAELASVVKSLFDRDLD